MATGAVPDGLFRSVYEGCIAGYDNCVERRPYHRNCSCALHNMSNKNCKHNLPMCNKVSYPMRRAWSEGNLALVASSAYSLSSSSSSSPAAAAGGRPQLSLVNLEDEEEENKKCFT